MKSVSLKEVVDSLTGPIEPLGQHSQDQKRLQNLKDKCDLVHQIMSEISQVTSGRGSHEQSVREIEEYADSFLKEYGFVDI